MISSLRFTSGYPTKLEGIGRRIHRFSPRLNILFGPNGSGKSTMLSTLAQLTGCGGGGWSDSSVAVQLPYKAEMSWDGHPVFFQDCYGDTDTSFLQTGYLESNSFLRSKGEKRIGLINEVVNTFESRFPTYKLPVDVRPTLLLDEVDNHLGLAAQSFFWNDLISALSKKYQLILATHSIYPILRHGRGLRPGLHAGAE